MEFQNHGIKCKTFWDAQAVIKNAGDKIKVAKSNKERRYYGQDILLEAETLLLCVDCNAGSPDCLSCHSVLRRYIKEYKYLAEDERKGAVSKLRY